MIKKTALALAVGGLFAAPAALAQTTGGGIEIYGRVFPQITSANAKGASTDADVTASLVAGDGTVNGNHARRTSVDVTNSRIGFRGEERLGGDMAVIWQIEQRVRFDTGTSGLWAGGRNSFAGLRSGFGTVRLGNMDTVYKEYGGVAGRFFGVSTGNFVSSSNVLSEIGLGIAGGSEIEDGGFHVRAPNSIQYQTPEFGAFQAGIQFSPDERKGNPTRAGLNTNLWSMGVKYEAGPLYAAVGHERHNDWFEGSNNSDVPATTTDSRDRATRVSVGFSITPAHRLLGDLSWLEWRESGATVAGDFEHYKKRTWAVSWDARWGGPWRTELAYVRANKGECGLSGGVECTTEGLEGSMLSAGVAYSMSKRTTLYSLATRLKNGASARFDNAANFDPNRGADTTQFAIGMAHSF